MAASSRRVSGKRASSDRDRAIRQVAAGVVMMLAGAVTIGFLVYVSNSQSPAAAHMMISIGLAGSALISATAQALVFGGGWMVWRGTRRKPR